MSGEQAACGLFISRKEVADKMDIGIKDAFGLILTSGEVLAIEAFLDRGFSRGGQIAIASIFLFAAEQEKPVVEVLVECEREWKRNWEFQHPEIKGDPDAPGAAGEANRTSLENIYHALNLPSPLVSSEKS